MEHFYVSTIRKQSLIQTIDWILFNSTFRGDTRSECKVIGGSPRQNYESCFDNIQVTDGCDRFSELDCTYTGEIDTQLSPPDGQIRSALECEELCVAYEVCKTYQTSSI